MVKNPREATSTSPIRSLNRPILLQVEEDGQGRPISVIWRGRRVEVTSIKDIWEVADEWWKARPINRRYFQVTLTEKVVVTIFHDMIGAAWYSQKA